MLYSCLFFSQFLQSILSFFSWPGHAILDGANFPWGGGIMISGFELRVRSVFVISPAPGVSECYFSTPCPSCPQRHPPHLTRIPPCVYFSAVQLPVWGLLLSWTETPSTEPFLRFFTGVEVFTEPFLRFLCWG